MASPVSDRISVSWLKQLAGEVSKKDLSHVSSTADLFEGGYFDSMTQAQFAMVLEDRLGVTFRTADLTLDKFRSFETILKVLVEEYGCRTDAD